MSEKKVLCLVKNEFISKQNGERIKPNPEYVTHYMATSEEFERLRKAGCLDHPAEGICLEDLDPETVKNINSDLDQVLNDETVNPEVQDVDLSTGKITDPNNLQDSKGGLINSMKSILGG